MLGEDSAGRRLLEEQPNGTALAPVVIARCSPLVLVGLAICMARTTRWTVSGLQQWHDRLGNSVASTALSTHNWSQGNQGQAWKAQIADSRLPGCEAWYAPRQKALITQACSDTTHHQSSTDACSTTLHNPATKPASSPKEAKLLPHAIQRDSHRALAPTSFSRLIPSVSPFHLLRSLAGLCAHRQRRR